MHRSVGDIEETVTVSGASPVVDIQNVEQRAVMDREVIDNIPTGKSLTSYGLLVPGMVGAESCGTTLSHVAINMIPREGANAFSGALFTTFGLPGLHADNLDADLRERGLESATKLERNFTIAPSFGGPIVEDRLWFWVNHTTNFADLQAPGVFHALDPGAFVFMPDPSRPGIDASTAREHGCRTRC